LAFLGGGGRKGKKKWVQVFDSEIELTAKSASNVENGSIRYESYGMVVAEEHGEYHCTIICCP